MDTSAGRAAMEPPVVLSSRTKELAIGKMRQNEAALAAKIDEMVARGELSVDEDGGVVGCDPLCGLLSRRRRKRVPAEASAPKSQSGLEKAVFGARSGKTMTAAERLAQAAESVQAHASQLSERSSAARARALELQMAGKKADALMALKRAKALEKQAATALSTHAALESQQDMLESSALQREIASALSASVASTKSKSKGLLSKTETAVDDAAELKDAFEEVTEALGGLQAQYGDDDDEELLAELQSMVAEVPVAAPTEAVATASPPTISGEAASASADVAQVVAAFPKAPKGKTERLGLLRADAAAGSSEG